MRDDPTAFLARSAPCGKSGGGSRWARDRSKAQKTQEIRQKRDRSPTLRPVDGGPPTQPHMLFPHLRTLAIRVCNDSNPTAPTTTSCPTP